MRFARWVQRRLNGFAWRGPRPQPNTSGRKRRAARRFSEVVTRSASPQTNFVQSRGAAREWSHGVSRGAGIRPKNKPRSGERRAKSCSSKRAIFRTTRDVSRCDRSSNRELLSPLRGSLLGEPSHPGLAPWAAFGRRSAALRTISRDLAGDNACASTQPTDNRQRVRRQAHAAIRRQAHAAHSVSSTFQYASSRKFFQMSGKFLP
jgi:hypothetical protein